MTPEGLMHVDAWVLFGLLGQSLFATRFVVQWLASERRGRSVVPTAFWYLSLAGGAILFAYALFHRHDSVFTVGQSAGMIVYVRNLLLIRRSRGGSQGAGAAGA